MKKFNVYDLVITGEKANISGSIGIITGTADDEYANSPDVEPGAYDDCYIVDFGSELGTCTVSADEMELYEIGSEITGRLCVGRPINGITINGNEYLLNDDGEVKVFENTREAVVFLYDKGFSPEEITELTLVDIDEQPAEVAVPQYENNAGQAEPCLTVAGLMASRQEDIHLLDVDEEHDLATIVELYPDTLTEQGRKDWADVLNAKVERIYNGVYGIQADISGCGAERLRDFSYMLAGHCSSKDYDRWVNSDDGYHNKVAPDEDETTGMTMQ